jgi:menaquinone-dependent protoporphyrinogen IX oxidase
MKVLIAYVSRSGSTREIAVRMQSELEAQGLQVEIQAAGAVADLSAYDAVIAGGLLYRLGWHPELLRFLRRHRAALRQKKVALFVTGLRLVRTPALEREAFPVFVDPAIEKASASGGRLTLAEWFTTYTRYLGPVLPLIREIQPSGLAFFAGSLQLFSLAPFERVTAILLMALTGIQPGDHRSWDAVREWSRRTGAEWCGGAPIPITAAGGVKAE